MSGGDFVTRLAGSCPNIVLSIADDMFPAALESGPENIAIVRDKSRRKEGLAIVLFIP